MFEVNLDFTGRPATYLMTTFVTFTWNAVFICQFLLVLVFESLDYPQFVLRWMVGDKQEVVVCVWASILTKRHQIQEV